MTETEQKIQTFVKKHGHSLHSQVVQFLRANDWEVLVSPFYRDNGTDKARETDIIAEKYIRALDTCGYFLGAYFRLRLVIECKYMKEQTIILFDQKNVVATERRIINDISLFKPSRENESIREHHFYTTNEVGKLFATATEGQEKQSENEVMFSAVDKVLNCLAYYRHVPALAEEERPKKLAYNSTVSYPLIVLNDFKNLYRTDMRTTEATIESLADKKCFQLEVNYASNGIYSGTKVPHVKYFLVDVLKFDGLGDYLKILEKDVRIASVFLPSKSN